jgi:hypothetical protein
MLVDRWFMFRYAFAVVVVVLSASDRVLAAAAERNRASTKVTRRCPTCPVCSNHSNMLVDRWFMFRYAFVIVVVVLGASERVLAGQAPGFDHPPAHHYALGRRSIFPVYANGSNMLTDICFVLEYAFAVVVVMLGACDRVLVS